LMYPVMVAGNLFIDSLFSLLFAFFSRMGECLSRLFFKSVRCQTKVNFSLRTVDKSIVNYIVLRDNPINLPQ